MSDTKSTALAVYQANSLLEKIVESGDLTPDLEAEIAHIELTGEERVDMAVQLLERVQAEIAYWKEQASRFTKIQRAMQKIEDRIKDGVKINMVERGVSNLEGNNFKFNMSERAPKLEVNEDLLPAEYYKSVVVEQVDDEKIREELKSGKRIPGARLVTVYALTPKVLRKKVTA